LALGTTLVPGLLLHGAGAYVVGKRQTAEKLLLLELGGIGLLAAGGVPIILTGPDSSGMLMRPSNRSLP
jgi:hypothetical protein